MLFHIRSLESTNNASEMLKASFWIRQVRDIQIMRAYDRFHNIFHFVVTGLPDFEVALRDTQDILNRTVKMIDPEYRQ